MSASDRTGSPSSTVAEILAKLGTDPNTGLNPAQVQERLTKYGPNALAEEKKSALSAFLAYFWGPIPWMIEAAALMALIVRDWGDFTIITSLLLFNASLLGFWEEHAASNALEALKSSFTLAPILFPTQLRATASGFAAGVAKIGATLGVFVLPILKGTFGVPAVLGMMAAVSVLGLVVTVVFGREDTED
jgi:cation transport ATPase-like protein